MSAADRFSSSPSVAPGLIALQGNRAEQLAETVLAWLSRHPLEPLESEVVLVQSNGVAEWFRMAMASHSGVCAAAQVELPGRFLWRSYRQILGAASVPPRSPVDKSALTWRLMRDLPVLVGQAGFSPLAHYLLSGEPDRLWQLASRLADLFDQYQVYRPDWLGDWSAGKDWLGVPQRPGAPVPPDQLWQPKLWRSILSGLSEEQRQAIRPQIHQRALAALQGPEISAGANGEASHGSDAAQLPRRVVLFGMTHVPLPVLEMLTAMARYCQVLLAIPNPCRFHWADAIDGREWLAMERRRQPLRQGLDLAALPLESLHAHAHPLLVSWGRQGRDFVRQLDAFDDAAASAARPGLPRLDLFDEGEADDAPWLLQVQNRIRDLVPLSEHEPLALAPHDRSIVFHSVHSALREVEVLHDCLLGLLANPPDTTPLAPRDIVVMVPDIEQFAPAIRAVFGQLRSSDARFIPWGIADLSARASHPLVGALDWLLTLPQQRCTLSEVQALLEVPAIAARLRLPADDVAQLVAWMVNAGIRWGVDGSQRSDLGLGACGNQNTADFGLERMLLGYAAGSASFDDIAGWDDIGGLDAELAGVLAALLARLRAWAESAQVPTTPLEWVKRFRGLLVDFSKPVDDADRQLLQALEAALGDWLTACDDAGFDAPLPLEIAREAWQQALDAPHLSQRFRAGGVTFCTLLPLRAIPFEVVCLLGMNDGDYPRRSPRSDFDLMALPGTARPGDRSRQGDDRQLMLEALLSARRVLYISWAGHSARDNSEQPPSVLVSQLRDYLAAGWGQAALMERTTQHPLQPFSRRYFEGDAALFTHSREWRAAHESRSPVEGEPDRDDARLPEFALPSGPAATLATLGSFVRHPARSFLRERLGVVFERAADDVPDDELFAVAGLEGHQLALEVLASLDSSILGGGVDDAPAAIHACSVADSMSSALTQLRAAGRLPMAGLGARAQQALLDELIPVGEAWQEQLHIWSDPAPRVRALLPSGESTKTPDLIAIDPIGISAVGLFDSKQFSATALDDWIEPLRRAGDGRVAALQRSASRVLQRTAASRPPRLRPEKFVTCWLQALAAAASGAQVHGVLVARDATVTWPPMDAALARRVLADVLALWQQHLQADAPTPLPLATALAQAQGFDAAKTYEGADNDAGAPGEATEPEWERFYPDFETLSADGRFQHGAALLHAPLAEWVATQLKITRHEIAAPALHASGFASGAEEGA